MLPDAKQLISSFIAKGYELSDASGELFTKNGKVYRGIYMDRCNLYIKLLANKELMQKLFKNGLVQTAISEKLYDGFGMVLEHGRVDFVSHYIEWPFDMFIDAAIKTVEIARLLSEYGYQMKDAHSYNILFKYSKPVFVDFSSIDIADADLNPHWKYGFFRGFILPLHFLAHRWKRISEWYFYLEDNPTQKIRVEILLRGFFKKWWKCFQVKSDYRESFDNIFQYLRQIKVKAKQTRWQDYYERGDKIIMGDNLSYTNKEKSAIKLLEILRKKGQKTLLDVGANEGWFAEISEGMGYEVVAIDNDHNAINNLYKKIHRSDKKILPLVIDFKEPTRTHGENERFPPARERFKCDVALCMSLVHHLSLSQNMKFDQIANRLNEFTINYAIVEFVGRDDKYIQHLLTRKRNWYNEKNFLNAMERHFILCSCLCSNPNTRKTYLFKKRIRIGGLDLGKGDT